MSDSTVSLDDARAAFSQRRWAAAHQAFESVSADIALGAQDLEMWSRAAWWLGEATEAISLAERAFGEFRADGHHAESIRTALRIALLRVTRGDITVGCAWMRRAEGLLSDHPDPALRAHLAYLDASIGASSEGSLWPASSVTELRDLAHRSSDRAIVAFNLVVSGMAALRAGDSHTGFAQLDEAMLGVLADEVEPEWGGDIFCTTIHVCHELADYQRMAEWTQATEQWCERFGSDAIYAGVCRVHRLELRSAAGEWDSVEVDLSEVCRGLAASNPWVAGEGWYQLGELRRHRGDAPGAREAYLLARQSGIDPVPGEALLDLHHGAPDRAWSVIHRALEGRDRVSRARLLRAAIEIAVGTGRLDQADAFRAELRQAADDFDSAGFVAWADQADGMVSFAHRAGTPAVDSLQAALTYFRRHRLRCEQARTLAWIAAAYELDGDHIHAKHVRDEASGLFEALGARAHLEIAGPPERKTGPLTAREGEVLELVALGGSNRDIAQRLFISEKTVGRHLANVYLKLGVGSRTAAAAWWRNEGETRSASM